jgi:hypothetical protein
VELFDAQAGFGGAVRGERAIVQAGELRDSMRACAVARALVRITPEQLDSDIALSNKKLYAACERQSGLVPCPVVAPCTAGDLASDEEQVASAVKHGAGAVVLRPGQDHWLPRQWVCGTLFGALEDRHVPVLCLERFLGLDDVASLAGQYPGLPMILAECNYRLLRSYAALLRAFSNTYVSVGPNLCIHRGIEFLAAEVGAERLLFGTGFPEVEPMAAVTMLAYAEISETERQQIGAGNLDRLTGEWT